MVVLSVCLSVLVFDGLRREGIAVASPELVVTGMHAASRSGGRSNRVMLRGVTDAAFDLRPEVEIVAGRMFEAGGQEMIVGARIAAELRGLGIGDVVAAGKSARYTVVGHFAAGAGPHESEAWADLPIVQSTHERPALASALWIRASEPGLLDSIRDAAQADARVEVQLIGERAYWENRASRVAPLLWTLAAAIGGLMAFGAGASTMCVSYWTVHGRAPQLATLRAVGFGRGAVALSLALETLALTLLGGIAGTAIAYLSFDGASAAMRNRGGNAELLTFDMAVTPAVAAIGLAAAAAIGLVGALLPAVQANRMRIAAALQRR